MYTVNSLFHIAAEAVSDNVPLLKDHIKDLPNSVLESLIPYLSGRSIHELNQVFLSKGIDTDDWWKQHIFWRWSKIHSHRSKVVCQDYLGQDGSSHQRQYMESHFHDMLFTFVNERKSTNVQRSSAGKYSLGNKHPQKFDIPFRQLKHASSSRQPQVSYSDLKIEDIYSLCGNVYCLSLPARISKEMLLHTHLLELLGKSVICLSLLRVKRSHIAFCEILIETLKKRGTLKCLNIDWGCSDVESFYPEIKHLLLTCAQQIPACQTLSNDKYYCIKNCDEQSISAEDSMEYKDFSNILKSSDSEEQTKELNSHANSIDLFDEAVAVPDTNTSRMPSQQCLCPVTGIKVLRMQFLSNPSGIDFYRTVMKSCDFSMHQWYSLETILFIADQFPSEHGGFWLSKLPALEVDKCEEDNKTHRIVSVISDVYSNMLTALREHRLRKLELAGGAILPCLFSRILNIFHSCYRESDGRAPMTSLTLTDFMFFHQWEDPLENILQSNEKLSAVQRLDISDFKFSEIGIEIEGLIWLLKHDTALTHLNVRHSIFPVDAEISLLSVLTDTHRLVELDFSGNVMDCSVLWYYLTKFLKASQSLKSLKLEETRIRGNSICRPDFIDVLKNHPSLEYLSLKGNKLGKYAVEWIWLLFESGRPVLNSVNLSANAISGQHLKEFIIRTLPILGANAIGGQHLKDFITRMLPIHEQRNANAISGQHLQEFITRMLPIHQQRKSILLSSLDLSCNDIYKDAVFAPNSSIHKNNLYFVKSLKIDYYRFDHLVDHRAEM